MVGSKPNAYLSEQTRLEAQRRMLAERYGLFSDDSDDADEPRRDSSTPAPLPANGASNSHLPASLAKAAPPANGRQPDSQPVTSEPSSSTPPPTVLPPPISASAAASDNQPMPSPASPERAGHDSPTTAGVAVAATAEARPLAWPPVEILDAAHANKIRARFDYPAESQPHPVPSRDVRVTQITHYSSQLLESHQRKIAVNNEVVSYGVGGHVRAMLRHSPARCLLKGHNSVVADIEFLSFQESRFDNRSSDHISILGSVADDGSVYVWKLVRNGLGDDQTLDVADAIRFEHPDFDKGKSYKRIAFRPGPNSIIAENGIGVAMLLLDINSTDLRIVELVKMNDKMMVRDKFLRARHEVVDGDTIDANLDAAAWLSETIVATSRGGHVFLWSCDNNSSCCIARVPRDPKSQVTAIHSLHQDTLLFVVSHGRELEVWVAKEIAPDMSSTSLQLNQTIRLFNESDTDVHCVASVDSSEELVTISNVRGNSFFVLHFNITAKAFDAMTEVPLKHSVYSFCVTPLSQAPLPATMSTQPSNAPQEQDELGVWCVQPPGIQVVHLPELICRPVSKVVPEIYPKPIMKTLQRKVEKIPPALIAQTQAQPPSSGSSDGPSLVKRMPRSLGGLKSNVGGSVESGLVGSSGMLTSAKGMGVTTGPPKPVSSSSTGGIAHGKSIGEGRVRGLLNVEGDTKRSGTSSGGADGKKSISLSSISTSVSSEAVTVSGDETVEAILNAAKKAIASFDEAAAERSANEKAKMDKLIETVSETAESNIERFINSSMKKVLAETLIPGVSEIIADARDNLREKSKLSGEVACEHFEEVMERAEINKSFSNACKEMGRQVSTAVTQSIGSKYESLVQPTIEMVNDAKLDLNTSVGLLREELTKLNCGDGHVEQRVVEIGAEDVRRSIEEQIAKGNVDDAFLTALDKEDLELVTWLCGKFEAGTFFLENSLSQVSLMSLAQQLGQRLGEGDVLLKLEWLREVMVALEPEAEDIESISSHAMEELVMNVNELKKNKELLEQHTGMERSLKTLARLITGHMRS